jgi:hypothetical protein
VYRLLIHSVPYTVKSGQYTVGQKLHSDIRIIQSGNFKYGTDYTTYHMYNLANSADSVLH